MVASSKKRVFKKSIKRGGSGSSASISQRMRALRGPLDFNEFFEKVNVVKTQFQRVLEAGPHVKILFKGEKKAFEDLVVEGKLNILLLNEKTIFEKSVRKMFENNEGLVFYRSVYVEHLVKIIHLLKIVVKTLTPGASTPGFDKLNVYFESAKLNLEAEEEEEKLESMRFLVSEEERLDRFYKDRKNEALLRRIEKQAQKYKHRSERVRRRIMRHLKRVEFNKTRGTISKQNLSYMSVCNVSKLLFAGYKPPHHLTKIAFNGKEYSQQHYKKTDSDSTVKTKIRAVLEFVKDNDHWLTINNNNLENKDDRLKYITHLEGGNCKMLITMLKFLNKSGGGGGRSIADDSGLSSLELPDVPVDSITLGLAPVPQDSLTLGLPDAPKGTPRSTTVRSQRTALRLGKKNKPKRKESKKRRGSKRKSRRQRR